MTFLAETLLVAAASYRVWRLAGQDSLTERIRDDFLPAPLKHFLECHWCAGSWTAIAVTAAAWALGWVTGPPVLVALAAAAVVGMIGERI